MRKRRMIRILAMVLVLAMALPVTALAGASTKDTSMMTGDVWNGYTVEYQNDGTYSGYALTDANGQRLTDTLWSTLWVLDDTRLLAEYYNVEDYIWTR